MLLGVPGWLKGRGKTNSFDRVVSGYETEAGSGPSTLSRYWVEQGSRADPSTLAALVKVDLQRRFDDGERPKILEYLEAFPVLAEDDDRVISLVYEEFCLLEEAGERPDSSAFCAAYGPWRDSLRSQLVYHRELSRAVGSEPERVDFPEPGDRFEKYRLTSVLGVGGVARVYLATEEELGGRQVAIKVSASFGQEPSILAKLNHRNIVPILTVARSETGLRGICMPYRPGTTLEDLIQRIVRNSEPLKKAREFGDALIPKGSPNVLPSEEQRVGWVGFPTDRSFPDAVAWIGLALANALAYLHGQGVYHRDIKPANILLAFREGPQLLDFNLAQVPSNPDGASAAQKGGTLPYMAPEQLRAFLDPSAWDDVEAAADLYSLGLVLRELLTGRPPERPTSQGSLAREIQSLIDRRAVPLEPIGSVNRSVPAALESIVNRCLAFRPEDRYASADELAADLRRFLDRKPLLVAPNTSKVELAVNWFTRNWRTAVVICFALVVSGAFATTLSSVNSSGQSQFLKAESYLDSSKREDWESARKIFEQLRVEHPETARSAIGLALTLRKLGDRRDFDRVSDLFHAAHKKEDAEEFLRARLAREPRSDFLHLNLGIVLEAKGRLGQAREAFEQSLRLDPEGINAMVMLARIAHKTNRKREALNFLVKAIELGRKNELDPSKVYELRQNILHVLVELADSTLELKPGAIELAQTAGDVQNLREHLQAFRDDRRRIVSGGSEEHEALVHYYEGCLASILGVVQVVEAGSNRSDALFAEAERHFAEAETLFKKRDASSTRLQAIQLQRQKLVTRRAGQRTSRL